jgi:hypothetical protein
VVPAQRAAEQLLREHDARQDGQAEQHEADADHPEQQLFHGQQGRQLVDGRAQPALFRAARVQAGSCSAISTAWKAAMVSVL